MGFEVGRPAFRHRLLGCEHRALRLDLNSALLPIRRERLSLCGGVERHAAAGKKGRLKASHPRARRRERLLRFHEGVDRRREGLLSE
jgi:hypothetical protein